MDEQTTASLDLTTKAFVSQRMNKNYPLHMEMHRLGYFLLFEYSMDYLYINTWSVYKFMAFLQYVFLKALRSLDRDYIFLISFPLHQSFIQDALHKKRKETHSYSPPSCIQLQLLCSRWGVGVNDRSMLM